MKKKPEHRMEDLRLNPHKRLCNKFDAASNANFEQPPDKMGVHVQDNCAEEHIM